MRTAEHPSIAPEGLRTASTEAGAPSATHTMSDLTIGLWILTLGVALVLGIVGLAVRA